MNDFKPGDLVRLKSGSPELTITDVRENGDIDCDWFVNGDLRRDAFPGVCLVAVDSSLIIWSQEIFD